MSSKIPELKKELGKALLNMTSEVDEEIKRGDDITLDQLNEAFEDED